MEHEDERLLDQRAMCRILGIMPKTAEVWRLRGRGPRFVKVGSLVRYRRRDILAYIESNTVRSTSEILPDDAA